MIISNIWIVTRTQNSILKNIDLLPDSSVVLVLGTSHKLMNGLPNPYFLERIQMAAKLYKEGKAVHFLLSGDNQTKFYNEPAKMKEALVAAGVPQSIITLDLAGLRTLDSIVRCKEIFGQHKIIIVTQPFHSYRALFISQYYGVSAVAIRINDQYSFSTLKMQLREFFARTKAVIDLYLVNTFSRAIE